MRSVAGFTFLADRARANVAERSKGRDSGTVLAGAILPRRTIPAREDTRRKMDIDMIRSSIYLFSLFFFYCYYYSFFASGTACPFSRRDSCCVFPSGEMKVPTPCRMPPRHPPQYFHPFKSNQVPTPSYLPPTKSPCEKKKPPSSKAHTLSSSFAY